MQTQLLGQPVRHISFGKGIITDISSQIVTVNFSDGEKRFLYPEAFSNFLTLKDTEKQKEVNAKHSKRLQADEAARKKEYEEQELSRQLRTMKIAPNSQAAFHVAPDEAGKIIESGSVSAGCYLSGYSKGQPRIPSRLKPNSACLLTGLPAGKAEKGRRILGAFMAKEDFWGAHCRNGIVTAHAEHRVCLPAGARLCYWDYFDQNETPTHWGRLAFKYFSNSTMQKILFDMTELLAGTEQEQAVNAFYQYFCGINRLPVKQPKAERAI